MDLGQLGHNDVGQNQDHCDQDYHYLEHSYQILRSRGQLLSYEYRFRFSKLGLDGFDGSGTVQHLKYGLVRGNFCPWHVMVALFEV